MRELKFKKKLIILYIPLNGDDLVGAGVVVVVVGLVVDGVGISVTKEFL